MRTVPIPTWVKSHVDAWTAAAAVPHGPVFRAINKAGRVWGDGMSSKVLWDADRMTDRSQHVHPDRMHVISKK